MSFSSQRAIYYLVNLVIPVLVANWLYKMPVVLKRQRFEDSRNNKMEPKSSKYQRLDLHDNKEEEGLDKFKGEDERENIKYVFFLFVAHPQKESNRPTDIGKGTKNLNHLVCIPKIG